MKREKAFTLVEVILALGVFAIVAIPIVSMFLDGIRITSKSENTSQAYAYAQQYIEKLKGGEIKVKSTDSPQTIDGTKYTYSINVNSLKTEEEIKAEEKADGEDFYKFMNETDSCKMILSSSGLTIGSTTKSSFDNIVINEQFDWVVDDTTISVKKDKVWLQYGDLAEVKTLNIKNESGKKIDIYLQWTGTDETKKNNVKIKNKGGITDTYGPVDKSIEEIQAENRGRKQTANVTVIVENEKEHAELTANVIYYDVVEE